MEEGRKCLGCGQYLLADMFSVVSKTGKLKPRCRPCRSAESKQWYDANPEKAAESRRVYHVENAEANRARAIAWAKDNPDRVNELARERYAKDPKSVYAKNRRRAEKNPEFFCDSSKRYAERHPERVVERIRKYRKENPHIAAAANRRRIAAKLQAIPPWADQAQLKMIYCAAAIFRLTFDFDIDVDHVVPLLSAVVCGLHVGRNLRITSAKENRSKGNRRWPDMPIAEAQRALKKRLVNFDELDKLFARVPIPLRRELMDAPRQVKASVASTPEFA